MYTDNTSTNRYERAAEHTQALPAHELTSAQEIDCERTIIYMFNTENYQVSHNEVGHHVRQDLSMEVPQWLATVQELVIRRKILLISKSDKLLERPDTLTLNLAGIIEAASAVRDDAPAYLTPEVVRAAEQARAEHISRDNGITHIGTAAVNGSSTKLSKPAVK